MIEQLTTSTVSIDRDVRENGPLDLAPLGSDFRKIILGHKDRSSSAILGATLAIH